MLIQSLIDFLRRLFGIKPRVTETEQAANNDYEAQYRDIKDINLTGWVANRIANIVVSDCDIAVEGKNARAGLLDAAMQTCAARLKQIVIRALAVGGVVLKPYIYGGRLYADILPQNRFVVIKQAGEIITAAGLVAEVFTRDNRTYTRIEYHQLENGNYTITQKGIENQREVPLDSVPEWAAIPPQQTITGVEQMLFGLVLCPTDPRGDVNSAYGVPVTYGQDKLRRNILELLNEFQREFKDKGVFVGISDLLFDGDNRLPADGIYRKLKTEDENFFEVFSPDIRAQAYIDGINFQLGLLEKAIGVNKGVLTDMETADATATAIKRSSFDTWALVDDARTNVETGLKQLLYAFDVYANVAGLTPAGEYGLKAEWDYSLREDSTERFSQLQEGTASGYIAPWEARAWVMDETPEQARANMPEMAELVGPE